MFSVKPIRDKDTQKTYCDLCKVPYLAEDMAYRIDVDDEPAGICQFRLENGFGVIDCLTSLPSIDDWEMMFIAGRTVMNFIDLCELHVCRATPDAADERLLTAIGFKKNQDGYEADMTGMFNGCRHHDKKE